MLSFPTFTEAAEMAGISRVLGAITFSRIIWKALSLVEMLPMKCGLFTDPTRVISWVGLWLKQNGLSKVRAKFPMRIFERMMRFTSNLPLPSNKAYFVINETN